jgi:hypothetical protein
MMAANAAATIASTSFAAFFCKLLRAACALGMFAAHMAVPFNHDTGQAIITYILLLTTPLLVYHLSSMLMPTSSQEARTLTRVFLQHPNIPGSLFQGRVPHKHWKKIKCK